MHARCRDMGSAGLLVFLCEKVTWPTHVKKTINGPKKSEK